MYNGLTREYTGSYQIAGSNVVAGSKFLLPSIIRQSFKAAFF